MRFARLWASSTGADLVLRRAWSLLLSAVVGRHRFITPPEMDEWQRFQTPLRGVTPNRYRIKPGM